MKKVIEKFKTIVTASDLKKNNLSLTDYHDLSMTLQSLQSIIDAGSGTTLLKNVADWCKRNKLRVTEESICFRVFAK